MDLILNIFLISLISGLSTGIGGLVVFFSKPNKNVFGFLMGFTAGVMLTLSFHELVNESIHLSNYIITTIGFGSGALFMFLIEYFIPHNHLPFKSKNNNYHPKLFKTGILTAIGITIHNIPEGIAVGAGYMHLPEFGLFIAMAIALHNIPEGIVTALPLHKCGMSKWKAFSIALFSGLVEPIGALMAISLLVPFKNLIPGALAFAAGVMVFITLDELIPTAREHGNRHCTAIGTIIGAIFVFILSGMFGI